MDFFRQLAMWHDTHFVSNIHLWQALPPGNTPLPQPKTLLIFHTFSDGFSLSNFVNMTPHVEVLLSPLRRCSLAACTQRMLARSTAALALNPSSRSRSSCLQSPQ
eukprot:1521822-Amphidinium_carterae.1